MRAWISRHWHLFWIAIHQWQIDVGEQERDWDAVDHAIDRRTYHEGQIEEQESREWHSRG
jgi:hypothetical protein